MGSHQTSEVTEQEEKKEKGMEGTGVEEDTKLEEDTRMEEDIAIEEAT